MSDRGLIDHLHHGKVAAIEWLREKVLRMTSQRSPVYVFHHIAKCGGTSVRVALRRWFILREDYQKGWTTDYPDPVDPASLRSHECLCGHWNQKGFHLDQRYPIVLEDPRFRIFTFFRDPLEARLSLYYYERSHRDEPPISLEQFLARSQNLFASALPITEGNVEEVLSRYFFIGTAEELQGSMNLLADAIGKPRILVQRKNVSRRDAQVEQIDPAIVGRFREQNALDYRIYEEAVRRFRAAGGIVGQEPAEKDA